MEREEEFDQLGHINMTMIDDHVTHIPRIISSYRFGGTELQFKKFRAAVLWALTTMEKDVADSQR